MSRFRCTLHLFIVALAILGFCRSAIAGEPQWLEVRSPHFSVVTDAGEKRGRDVAVKFEQMRAVFGALFTKANVNLPIPLQIVAFRNTKELHSTDSSSANEEPKPVNLPSVPANFLKGKLVKVDCSAVPTAVLTVVSGTKTWKMKVADTRHAIVIGADNFSCDWTNQKVALNYHATGDTEGSVMSVEIQ